MTNATRVLHEHSGGPALSRDVFAAFVVALSEHLDDHGVRSPELAADLFLSRSHLDRLVSLAAGESPARFRRRVLLERAAFRLITTDSGVLDIAIEAGYSSHEAFTRAFAKAYGTGPAAWRLAPGAVLLTSPNGVHFHPPAGLRLPARAATPARGSATRSTSTLSEAPPHTQFDSGRTSMNLLLAMMDHHVWLVGELVDRAGTVDPDDLDAPIATAATEVDDDPTLRRLLSRLMGQMDMWNRALALQDYDFAQESHEELPALRARLDQVTPVFLDHVRRAVTEDRLEDTFVHASSAPPKIYSYGGLIAHVLTFAAYRRTLAVGALASAGVTDLGFGDPREWVAEPGR